MTKPKRPKPCKTKPGSAARKAISKVDDLDDLDDLRTLQRVCRERAEKLALESRERRNREAWDALEPGLYRLRSGFMMHNCLVTGTVYRVTKYVGRKHKGAHCVDASIENPRPKDHVWLDWSRTCDIEPAENAENDTELQKRHGELVGMFSRMS